MTKDDATGKLICHLDVIFSDAMKGLTIFGLASGIVILSPFWALGWLVWQWYLHNMPGESK